MKQHISLKQLNELSLKKNDELRYWLIEHHAEPFLVDAYESDMIPIPQIPVYLPNIGQMIEFLDEKTRRPKPNEMGIHSAAHHKIFITRDGGYPTEKDYQWSLSYEIIYEVEQSYKNMDLCDALWEAVKEVLEKG